MSEPQLNASVQEHLYPEGFSVPENYEFKAELGLNEEIVCDISARKNEPLWVLELRLKGLENFTQRPMQKWGPNLSKLDHNDIHYYIKPAKQQFENWSEVPSERGWSLSTCARGRR